MSRTSRFFLALLFFVSVFVAVICTELVLASLMPETPRILAAAAAGLSGAILAVLLLVFVLLRPLGTLSAYSQHIVDNKDFSNTAASMHSRSLATLSQSIFEVNSYIQSLFLLMKDNINSAIETSELLSMHEIGRAHV